MLAAVLTKSPSVVAPRERGAVEQWTCLQTRRGKKSFSQINKPPTTANDIFLELISNVEC